MPNFAVNTTQGSEMRGRGRITSTFLQYVFAFALVGLATVIRLLLNPVFPPQSTQLVFFFLATIAVMRLTSLWPSIFAVFLSVLALDYFFLPPVYTLGVKPAQTATLTVFAIANLLILGLAQSMRRAQARAEAYEQRLCLAEKAAQAGAYEWNPRTGKGYWADELWPLFGLPLHSCEPTYEAWRDCIIPEDREQAVRMVQAAAGAGAEINVEWRVRNIAGEERWLYGVGQPQRNGAGEVTHYLGFIFDITQRKRAELALMAAQEQLRSQNENLEQIVQDRTAKLTEMVRELEHFSYAIIHDLRAPLRAMTGFSKVIIAQASDRLLGPEKDFLNRIETAAQRMDMLIRDALQYSKAVREEIKLSPVDPGTLLRGMIETYPQLHPPAAEIMIHPEMPRVMGNEAALTQCFSNLLNNAVQYVAPGVKPQIRVWAEPIWQNPVNGHRSPQLTRIWFEDNGVGIAKEHIGQIWDMFGRLDENGEGTGIGLSLVRKLVQRMKGQVGVESEPGHGSRFWIALHEADRHE